MFTGIITELGKVESVQFGPKGARLCVRCPETSRASIIGDSIAINGVCLTVTDLKGDTACFDVSLQTLKVTTTSNLKAGDRVNIEPALRPSSRLGGHFVSGHVEDTGKIVSRKTIGNSEHIDIEAPETVMRYVIPKGSIAVDGISLTVVEVKQRTFSLVIIPHTLKLTTLGFKRVGDMVNLEPDMLAKYVAHFVSLYNKDASPEKGLLSAMTRAGYI